MIGEPKLDERGLALPRTPSEAMERHQLPQQSDVQRLPWSQIEAAFADAVGEPEGIRAIVYDLALRRPDPEGMRPVLRFSLDPWDGAAEVAKQLVTALGASRCSTPLQILAAEGALPVLHPDLSSLDAERATELEAL